MLCVRQKLNYRPRAELGQSRTAARTREMTLQAPESQVNLRWLPMLLVIAAGILLTSQRTHVGSLPKDDKMDRTRSPQHWRPHGMADYLSYTSRSHLVSDGQELLAWAESTRGVVNIFSAQMGSHHTPLKLSSHAEDDGTVIDSLRLVKSRYHRNGLAIWTQGPADGANPVSLTAESSAVETMMAVPAHLRNSQPFVIAKQAALGTPPPRLVDVTPDGEFMLIALQASTGFVLCEISTSIVPSDGRQRPPASGSAGPRACGHVAGATFLLRVTAGALLQGAAAWSPDGKTLALAVQRYDHAFMGVWRRGDSRLSWIAPSTDTDMVPSWSSDSQRLAFIRASTGPDARGWTPRDYNEGYAVPLRTHAPLTLKWQIQP